MAQAPVSSLREALNCYDSSRKVGERQEGRQDLICFVQWCGRERSVHELTPSEIADYADSFGAEGPDSQKSLESVRNFLAYLKKQGWASTNLAVHLRVAKTKRGSKQISNSALPKQNRLTKEGYALLQTRLEMLIGERVEVIEDIKRAMADKDFRENAPLDAAKERQGFIEASIRDLEDVLNRAVVAQGEVPTGNHPVAIGHRVTLREPGSGRKVTYTLVNSREANPTSGKISSDSPVGRALLDKAKGEEVQINVPRGTLRYVIEQIQIGAG